MNLLWASEVHDGDYLLDFGASPEAEAVKLPEIPPPVWDTRPIDAERCMSATRAMCESFR